MVVGEGPIHCGLAERGEEGPNQSGQSGEAEHDVADVVCHGPSHSAKYATRNGRVPVAGGKVFLDTFCFRRLRQPNDNSGMKQSFRLPPSAGSFGFLAAEFLLPKMHGYLPHAEGTDQRRQAAVGRLLIPVLTAYGRYILTLQAKSPGQTRSPVLRNKTAMWSCCQAEMDARQCPGRITGY